MFVYGTLEIPEVVRALLGRVPAGEVATLRGYVRGMVRGRSYPGARTRAGAETVGIVYEGVSGRELRLLDRFEGTMYRRRRVRVRTGPGREVAAQVYVLSVSHRHRLTGRSWDRQRFRDEHLGEYTAHCTALRRGLRGGVR